MKHLKIFFYMKHNTNPRICILFLTNLLLGTRRTITLSVSLQVVPTLVSGMTSEPDGGQQRIPVICAPVW